MTDRGLLVAVEGIDASGKTSLVALLDREFQAMGTQPLLIKEPADNAAGRLLRELSKTEPLDPMAAALLSSAARHLAKESVQNARAMNRLVVADRYYLSGLAYHAADGIALGTYASLNHGIPRPDLYLWLEVSDEVSLQRKPMRLDRWETPAFTKRVLGAYREAVQYIEVQERASVCRIDGERGIGDVLSEAIARILDARGTRQ